MSVQEVGGTVIAAINFETAAAAAAAGLPLLLQAESKFRDSCSQRKARMLICIAYHFILAGNQTIGHVLT